MYWIKERFLPNDIGERILIGMTADAEANGKLSNLTTEEDSNAMMCRWVRLAIQNELEQLLATAAESAPEATTVHWDVEGVIVEGEAPSLSLEAEKEAMSILTHLRSQDKEHSQSWQCDATQQDATPWDPPQEWDDAAEAGWWDALADWPDGHDAAYYLGTSDPPASSHAGGAQPSLDASALETQPVPQCVPVPQETVAASAPSSSLPRASRADGTENSTVASGRDKPLVDPPEFGDRIKDTERVPYWIPGAFPTIFQNETGDPHNWAFKEVDLPLWGPHVMRSIGWVAQAHMTFMYWWLNMIQRFAALRAKKWYIRDNPRLA